MAGGAARPARTTWPPGLGCPGSLEALADRYRRERAEWRGLVMLARSPAVAAPGEDVPWPESPPPSGDDAYPGLVPVRGPPSGGVLALFEEHLGPVEVNRCRMIGTICQNVGVRSVL